MTRILRIKTDFLIFRSPGTPISQSPSPFVALPLFRPFVLSVSQLPSLFVSFSLPRSFALPVSQSPRPKVSSVRHFQIGKFSNFQINSNPQPDRKKIFILSRKKCFQTYMCLLGIKKAWKECPTTFLISLFPVKG